MTFKLRPMCEASENNPGSEKLAPRKPAIMTGLAGRPGHLLQGRSAPSATPGTGMRRAGRPHALRPTQAVSM